MARKRNRRWLAIVGPLLGSALLLGACGTGSQHAAAPSSTTTTSTSMPPTGPPRYWTITPLARTGPTTGAFCAGVTPVAVPVVATRRPGTNARSRSCGDFAVKVDNLDWSRVKENTAYRLVGTMDDMTLSLTQAPTPAVPDAKVSIPRFPTPCPAPPGGWKTRRDHASVDDYNALVTNAPKMPGYADLWLGAHVLPQAQPLGNVLVFAFTHDVDARRAEIEKVWGGPLCVTTRPRSEQELKNIAGQFNAGLQKSWHLKVWSWGADGMRGVARVGVVYVPPGVQEKADARFGKGVVEFDAALKSL